MRNGHSAEQEDDPEERFIRVLQYYLAGWHIKPKGVKKPCVTPSSPFCTAAMIMIVGPN